MFKDGSFNSLGVIFYFFIFLSFFLHLIRHQNPVQSGWNRLNQSGMGPIQPELANSDDFCQNQQQSSSAMVVSSRCIKSMDLIWWEVIQILVYQIRWTKYYKKSLDTIPLPCPIGQKGTVAAPRRHSNGTRFQCRSNPIKILLETCICYFLYFIFFCFLKNWYRSNFLPWKWLMLLIWFLIPIPLSKNEIKMRKCRGLWSLPDREGRMEHSQLADEHWIQQEACVTEERK